MWLPPGNWVDMTTGAVESGNRILNRSYTLWETPSFARAGFMQPLTVPVSQGMWPCECVCLWHLQCGSRSLSLSLYPSLYLSLCLSLFLSLCVYLCRCGSILPVSFVVSLPLLLTFQRRWEYKAWTWGISLLTYFLRTFPDDAWGHAALVQPVLTWRIWHGGVGSGSGFVVEENRTTTASFTLADTQLAVRRRTMKKQKEWNAFLASTWTLLSGIIFRLRQPCTCYCSLSLRTLVVAIAVLLSNALLFVLQV